MKTLTNSLFLFCFFILCAGVIIAQNEPPPAKINSVPTAVNAQSFDYGTVENNTYVNKFFGVRFSVPENWEVQPRTFGDAVVETGGNAVKGKSTAMQKAIDESQETTKVLISLKKGLGSGGMGTLIFTAESFGRNAVFITSGTDYLRASLNGFKQSVLPPDYEVVYEIKQDKLGENTLPYFEAKRGAMKQRFYGLMRNGHGLLLMMMYTEESDLETMREILRKADLTLK